MSLFIYPNIILNPYAVSFPVEHAKHNFLNDINIIFHTISP